jgi:hypothetical protein
LQLKQGLWFFHLNDILQIYCPCLLTMAVGNVCQLHFLDVMKMYKENEAFTTKVRLGVESVVIHNWVSHNGRKHNNAQE